MGESTSAAAIASAKLRYRHIPAMITRAYRERRPTSHTVGSARLDEQSEDRVAVLVERSSELREAVGVVVEAHERQHEEE